MHASAYIMYIYTYLYSNVKSAFNLQRPSVAEDGEFIMEVEGKKYGGITSFCYLGDTLDGSGGADEAA